MGKPGECTIDSKTTAVPAKRGYKTHVPSACRLKYSILNTKKKKFIYNADPFY
jgi:hypothetical protein